MGKQEKLLSAFRLFDAANAEDPNKEEADGKTYPKELLYAIRMSGKLDEFAPQASEALKLTARCQHIRRWEIPRESYDMDRTGYLKWRQDLKKFHADKATEILESIGYPREITDRVAFLLQKKKLRRDPETQTLEDVICLVFLQYYLEPFMEKHPEDKLIDILRKTWGKMSEEGRDAALRLPLSENSRKLIGKAIEGQT